MSAPKDGGPAFPATGMYAWNEATQQADHLLPSQGMSLRDHFAGLAMQGMLSDPAFGPEPARAAAMFYEMADAMLAERTKGQPVDPAAEAAPDLLAACYQALALHEPDESISLVLVAAIEKATKT